MTIIHHLRSVALMAASLTICATASAQAYRFVALEGATGPMLWASAINNTGQVAATAYDPKAYARAAMWSDNQSWVLEQSAISSEAIDINASGQIAGNVMSQEQGTRATVWSNGARTQLATVDGSGDYRAVTINDEGMVAGNRTYNRGTEVNQAVAWVGFNLITLDMHGADSSFATAINNSGQITGYLRYNGRDSREYAAVWNGVTATVLQSPGSNECCTRAADINDSGIVVGSGSNGGVKAVAWRDGLATTLTSPDEAYAFSINNNNQIVGSFNAKYGSYHAGLWNLQTNELIDLNTFLSPADIAAGWSLVGAYDINDRGDIVGQAYNSRIASFRPFALLAVPEPGTLALMLLGVLALMAANSRQPAA